MPPVRRTAFALVWSCVFGWGAPVAAAPVPRGEMPAPGKRPPTPAELDSARKAYEAVGGRHYKDLGADMVFGHHFELPRDVPASAYAQLPDLPFEYELHVTLGENITAGTLGQLGRLKGLRSIELRCVLTPRERPANRAALLAELAAVPNLERLSLRTDREDSLADELAAKLSEFKSLRAVLFWSALTDAGLVLLRYSLRGCDSCERQ